MGREEVEAYVTRSSRGRRLPVIFMLLAIVVATAFVVVGVVLGGGGMAMAKKQAKAPATSSDATIVATAFQVAKGQTGEEYAKCPANKRALGGGVVQSGDAAAFDVRASGPLDETNVTANTVSGDIAKQWYAAVANHGSQPRDLKVFAICQ
jgi:hypothetical protein